MKKSFIILFTLISIVKGFSQSIDMQTISNAGESLGKLDFTFGEMIIAGSDSLTQGFQQGNLVVTSVIDWEKQIQLTAFPNPFSEHIIIQSNDISMVNIEVFDIRARHLLTKRNIKLPYRIDFSYYDTGLYIVKVFNKNSIIKTIKVEKIQ